MATHSSVLAWRIPGTGSLVGCHLWDCTESDMTEHARTCGGSIFRFFEKPPYCFPQWLHQFTFPLTVSKGSLFTASWSTLVILVFLMMAILSGRCEEFFFNLILFFLAAQCSMQGLSSLSRDRSLHWGLSYWSTREGLTWSV